MLGIRALCVYGVRLGYTFLYFGEITHLIVL